jgi:hypothetical protein
MSIATFVPEVWSRTLLAALRRAHVYGMLVNRDYEGEIAAAGDTVHINTVGDPTVDDYVPNVTEVEPEELDTAKQSLLVDQSKFYAFKVDDVDARQAAGNVIPQAMTNAGFRLRDVLDAFLELLIRTGVQASNVLPDVTTALADPSVVYNTLVDLATVLEEADVPMEGLWAVVPPWVHGLLLKDDRFVSFATAESAATRSNGRVGRAAGFDIHVSNQNPNHTGDLWPVHAGHMMAVSLAEQIPSNTTEAYRPEKGFSDAVKGLHVYGAKVVRPDAIATVDLERTAA